MLFPMEGGTSVLLCVAQNPHGMAQVTRIWRIVDRVLPEMDFERPQCAHAAT
jgi:hypothetical protein